MGVSNGWFMGKIQMRNNKDLKFLIDLSFNIGYQRGD